jgi:alkylated DNA repair dioxygenase AlkB
VAVLSPCNAWAVGNYSPGQTLITHWDGASWTAVPSPNPGTEDRLSAVTALSANNAWAVGEYFDGTAFRTLTVHWDGSAWTQVPSPNVSGSVVDSLAAVRGTSASNVWAVGHYNNSSNVSQTLTLHWNGSAWKVVPSPDPSGPALDQELTGVAGSSAQDAWAVGFYYNGSFDKSMILHWNGSAWKQVTSPSPGSQGTFLFGVRTTSASNAWAVGSSYNGTADKTLTVHWDGSAWKQVKSPNPGGATQNSDLAAVAATTPTDAWAVGSYGTGAGMRTLVLHWNGSAWQQTTTPNLGGATIDDALLAVGASTASDVWAVGGYYNGAVDQNMAIHCC